jgi:hypothetical protein
MISGNLKGAGIETVPMRKEALLFNRLFFFSLMHGDGYMAAVARTNNYSAECWRAKSFRGTSARATASV